MANINIACNNHRIERMGNRLVGAFFNRGQTSHCIQRDAIPAIPCNHAT
jgi:hypothetical protein